MVVTKVFSNKIGKLPKTAEKKLLSQQLISLNRQVGNWNLNHAVSRKIALDQKGCLFYHILNLRKDF